MFAFLVPLTFPSVQNASFFSSSLVERRPPFNFIDLYIPANPFNALANNVVPAVVLFSVILGIALVGVDQRERVLEVLQVARDAIGRATRSVTRLTPYGLFAIAANAAGTLGLEQLSRLQIYLMAYVAIALMVSLWVLPGLIAALTPIRLRDVLSESRNALITATIAGDLFIVLPSLMQACDTLLRRISHGDEDAGRLTEVIVPASFNFPHTGKLLSLSFVLFAGLVCRRDRAAVRLPGPRADRAGDVLRQPQRGGAVSPRSVPDSRRYVPAVPGHRRHQLHASAALAAAMHTLTVAAAGLVCGDRPAAVAAGAAALLCGRDRDAHLVVLGGTRLIAARGLSTEYSRDKVLASMHLLHEPVTATVEREWSPAPPTNLPPLETIAARKQLRVGYLPDALPFAFFNQSGDLVGFDVELAHRLAREMGVASRSFPRSRAISRKPLADGYCDLIMSGCRGHDQSRAGGAVLRLVSRRDASPSSSRTASASATTAGAPFASVAP